MKNILSGKTIITGIIIFLVLVLAVFYFFYFKNLKDSHPMKQALSKVPVLSRATSRQEKDPQEIIENEKARIEEEWEQIENQKKQLADWESQLAKRESELEALQKELDDIMK